MRGNAPGRFVKGDHRRLTRRSRALSLVGLLTLSAVAAHAAERELVELSLEELMDEPVTSVSKKETRLGDSAAAVTVITPEDLRRLGITSIPEALRLVPGFDVARIDGHHWAVSSRGFNQQFANMLLVLVDGRSVFTPTFGGVQWNMQDFSLADLERIEIIRGPGASLWGANAVNGVVNIITRRASDTRGAVISAAAGNEDQPSIEARYGGSAGEALSYRVYSRYFDREGLRTAGPNGRTDDWSTARVGFRADWQPDNTRSAVLQSDYFSMDNRSAVSGILWEPPYSYSEIRNASASSFNVLGRYTQSLSDVSHVSVQAYIDTYWRISESRDTFDLQLEHRFAVGSRNDLQWGVSYRTTSDSLELWDAATVDPVRSSQDLVTAFLQDEITLLPQKLRLTLGTKLEHHDYTGLEVQPTIRMLWNAAEGRTLWASASRAVSTPPRFYNDGRLATGVIQPEGSLPIQMAIMPNRDLKAQRLNAYEIGARTEAGENVSLELATFYNSYDRVYIPVQEAFVFEPTPVPHLLLPLRWQAVAEYASYGAEAVVNYRPAHQWRLTGSYSWLHLRGKGHQLFDRASPAHQVAVRSYATLSPRFELNTSLAWVSSIDSMMLDTSTIRIPAYLRLDAGVVFHATPSLEVGVWGKNLSDANHAEINSLETTGVTQIPRSVLVRMIKRF
jgi:iron complex outermembrane receptor protein